MVLRYSSDGREDEEQRRRKRARLRHTGSCSNQKRKALRADSELFNNKFSPSFTCPSSPPPLRLLQLDVEVCLLVVLIVINDFNPDAFPAGGNTFITKDHFFSCSDAPAAILTEHLGACRRGSVQQVAPDCRVTLRRAGA